MARWSFNLRRYWLSFPSLTFWFFLNKMLRVNINQHWFVLNVAKFQSLSIPLCTYHYPFLPLSSGQCRLLSFIVMGVAFPCHTPWMFWSMVAAEILAKHWALHAVWKVMKCFCLQRQVLLRKVIFTVGFSTWLRFYFIIDVLYCLSLRFMRIRFIVI
jgi:hypothetical protein